MIIVMGLPGAGKTTVLEGFAKKNPEYKLLNYGTLMFEIAKEKYKIENRDQIRILSAEEQKGIQKIVGEKLATEVGKVVLDTHCSVLNPHKKFYLPGLPYSLLKELKVDLLVLITGEIEEIATRRESDSTRVRKVDLHEIKEHDMYNKMLLASYSAISGAPAKIIINRNGMAEEAIEEFCSAV
ncbi:MAG: adenylate kinase [Candidatus Micrarchaeia archaeon]